MQFAEVWKVKIFFFFILYNVTQRALSPHTLQWDVSISSEYKVVDT